MIDTQSRFNRILLKLKYSNYRITPQRLAIIKILSASIGHPSVENMYEQLKQDFPTISLATVYKNVATIKEMGEVLELAFNDGTNRYDGNNPCPHPHVICTKCKKIVDSHQPSIQNMVQQVSEESGFSIATHRIDFFGLCPECQKKEKSL